MTTTKSAKRSIAVLAVVSMSVGACEFISPIESNPNAVPTATVDQLFTGVQVMAFFQSTSGLSRIASIWTQQMRGTNRQHAGFDAYTIGESDFNDEFDNFYTGGGLIDVRTAIAQAEAANRLHYAGILKIHEAYLMGLAASFYGDIPYSEAATDVEFPAVDDQAAVYAALQALLDDAIADLGSGAGGTGPGAIDMAFAGNTARWIAVAYTPKARYHMHWAEVNGAPSYTAARDAALLGVRDASGNWRTRFGTSATEESPWFQFMRDRGGDVAAGDYLLPQMVANSDPRISRYYSSPYVAGTSVLSPTGYGANNATFPIVTCAETLFIEAEARFQLADEPGARTAANAAIDCEEAEFTPAVDLSAAQTAITGASGAALFDAIMYQKYAAQFLNPDVFNDYKRTCRPAITERAAGMPGRLFYGENERQANPNIDPPNVGSNGKYNDNDPTPC
jgi:hypothetical protein